MNPRMKTIIATVQHVIMIGCAFAVPIPPSPIAISAKAAISARIVEENTGEGIEGVPVVCILPSSKNVFGDLGYTVVTNLTDKNGEVHFSGRAYDDEVEYFVVDRIGYYRLPYIHVYFTNMTESLVKKWLPYDEVQTITLQKFGKKIPLFVKEARPKRKQDLTTASDRKFCYDLVKGDWMPPFGKGEHADIEFQLLPRKDFGIHTGLSGIPGQSYRDEITMRFTGEDNGIISMIPPPNAVLKIREAPTEGYGQQSVSWFGRDKNIQPERSDNKEKCQAFRIRTVKDAGGKIISALYGKVYGGFPLTYKVQDHPSGVSFTYYLNLTPNDRNLEWDMKHNLCPIRGSFNQP